MRVEDLRTQVSATRERSRVFRELVHDSRCLRAPLGTEHRSGTSSMPITVGRERASRRGCEGVLSPPRVT